MRATVAPPIVTERISLPWPATVGAKKPPRRRTSRRHFAREVRSPHGQRVRTGWSLLADRVPDGGRLHEGAQASKWAVSFTRSEYPLDRTGRQEGEFVGEGLIDSRQVDTVDVFVRGE